MFRLMMKTFFLILVITTLSFAQSLGIEKYGNEFRFMPDNLWGVTRLSDTWTETRHIFDFPEEDSTLSSARWQSGDFGLSDVTVMFSPRSLRGRWVFAGQWLSYEGYNPLDKNDLYAGYASDNQVLTLSVVNIKPRLYESAFNRFTGWESRTRTLDWKMETTVSGMDVTSFLTGSYSRYKSDRGDSLLTGRTQYAEWVGGIGFGKDWWSVDIEGEWYEAWPGDDHFRFSQVNVIPVLQNPLGEIGMTLSSNNEETFGYDGWVSFFYGGLEAKFVLESRFYPSILITRYGADTEADFLSAHFSLEHSFGDWIHLTIQHGWSQRLDETFYLGYQTDTQTFNAVRFDPAVLMHGNGVVEIGRPSLMADFSWEYRDFNGLEYLWYYPGVVNLQPGFQAGSTFFKHLNLLVRVEGLFQLHENPSAVWFESALPGYIPVAGNTDRSLQSDVTLNGKITARVKSFTLAAGIENILQKEVYTARNIMPNSRMFVLDIQWIWYQ